MPRQTRHRFHPPGAPPSMPASTAMIAQRLLAYARLCRDIAASSPDGESAQQMDRLADACIRAAGASLDVHTSGRLH